MARHQRRRQGSRVNAFLVGVSVLAVVTLVVVVIRIAQPGDTAAALRTGSIPSARTDVLDPTAARAGGSSAAHQPTGSPTVGSPTAALQQLVHTLPPGASSSSDDDASVAAFDLTTGRALQAGASHGMTLASVGKLQVLETVLLARQRMGRTLSGDEVDDLTAMIERSDNQAADRSFRSIDSDSDSAGPSTSTAAEDDETRRAAIALGASLGLSSSDTAQGAGILWGLTTSSATQQIVLLKNLMSSSSPLDRNARTFALDLLSHVEPDQRWGVGEVEDSTVTAMKDGWLPVDTDHKRWADNSVGILKVRGHVVLLAVLTQHNDTDDHGRDRVAELAQAAIDAVLGR